MPTPEMPRKGIRVERRRRLLRVAASQHGLFTTAQAADAGLDRRARHHHLTYGNWRRTVAPHVFRLAGWPADEHERMRAWLLWAGPEARLTSWTALGLLRLVGTGPRVPVDLEIPFSADRAGRRRRQVLCRQIDAVDAAHRVRLHRGVRASSLDVDDLSVRPPAIAMCAAVRAPSSIALGLAEQLLDGGHLELYDLLDAARATRCTPLTEVLFGRLHR